MIVSFDKELKELTDLLEDHGVILVGRDTGMRLAMILAGVLDRGMAMERRRCLDIVARKAMNAAAVRQEIERPIR